MQVSSKFLRVIKSSLAIPINGAERSTFERLFLLGKLHAWHSEIVCLIAADKTQGYIDVLSRLKISVEKNQKYLKYEFLGIPVFAYLETELTLEPVTDYKAFSSIIKGITKERERAISICNMRDFAALYYCSQLTELPSIYFVTENEYPRQEQLQSNQQDQAIFKAYNNAKHVFVASNFLRESLKQSWSIEARVVKNAIDINFYSQDKESTAELITMLHPFAHKGVEVFIKIVKALPNHKFMIIGASGREYRERKSELLAIPNLTLIPFQSDIRPIFQKSRIVLVPSLWEEAFSRVIVEALASQTPVITYDRGGMREAGAEAAFYINFPKNPLDSDSILQWVEQILALQQDDLYQKAVQTAKSRSLSYKEELEDSLSELNLFLLNLLSS